jgi:hypothetical protein
MPRIRIRFQSSRPAGNNVSHTPHVRASKGEHSGPPYRADTVKEWSQPPVRRDRQGVRSACRAHSCVQCRHSYRPLFCFSPADQFFGVGSEMRPSGRAFRVLTVHLPRRSVRLWRRFVMHRWNRLLTRAAWNAERSLRAEPPRSRSGLSQPGIPGTQETTPTYPSAARSPNAIDNPTPVNCRCRAASINWAIRAAAISGSNPPTRIFETQFRSASVRPTLGDHVK